MPKEDAMITLLTEIRDLQKGLNEAVTQNLRETRKARQLQLAGFAVKAVLYGGIIVFTMVATYFYYKTISSISGL